MMGIDLFMDSNLKIDHSTNDCQYIKHQKEAFFYYYNIRAVTSNMIAF